MDSNLLQLIADGESLFVEFKETFGKETIETIVAFANTGGGFLFIGVSDKGILKGVEVSKSFLEKWQNQIKTATEPHIFPALSIINHAQKRFVLIQVQEYPIKPVAYKGRFFKRIGASNHLLTPDEIVELNIISLNASFDSFAVSDNIEKLIPEALDTFYKDIDESGRYSPSGNIENDLEKLGFVKEGHLTRAAELLFGNHHTGIHIGRFKSRHTIIDDLMIRAPLMQAIDETMEFIKKNIRLGYEFTGELKRKETWQYPLPALRELLLNAVIHKDYRNPTDVIIKIFDESIEFTNPGKLFGTLKLEELSTDFYRSSHRNKLLAEAFYLTGDVEKYGTGFIRIRNMLTEEYKNLDLQINSDSGGFWVTLSINQKTPVVESASPPFPNGGLNGGLNLTLQELFAFIKENPGLKTKELSRIINRSTNTLEKQIKQLVDKNLLERRGSKKTGGYWVKQLTKE